MRYLGTIVFSIILYVVDDNASVKWNVVCKTIINIYITYCVKIRRRCSI